MAYDETGGLLGTSESYSQSEALSRFVPLDSMTGIHTPKLRDAIIDGVLRQGHMMMLTGPPKAGKSWAMIQLAYATATGSEWMGYPCRQGAVVYVDTEMDKSSLFNRFDLVRSAMELPDSCGNIHVMSLRGATDTLTDVVDTIIDAFGDSMPALVVIDSIYTLEVGDENNNGEMRDTLKELARLTAAGPSVTFAHHHAKGAAGNRSMIDRGAGAGAFGRFVDAHIDLNPVSMGAEEQAMFEAKYGDTAVPLRMAFVLREFRDKRPREVVFDFPLLREVTGVDLSDQPEEGTPEAARQKGTEANKRRAKDRWDERDLAVGRAVNQCHFDGVPATRANVRERIGEVSGKEVTKTMLENWTKGDRAKFKVGTNHELYCTDESWSAETS